MYFFGNIIVGFAHVLNSILFIYTIVILGAVIVSWVNADPYNPIVRALKALSEPVFNKVRNYIPPMSGFDLTPIVVLFIIIFIQNGIIPSIITFGASL